MPLTDLRPGERARILAIAEGPLRQRLLEMGFGEDAELACVLRSPLGDPTAYRVRGVTIALRRRDAASVLVESLPPKAATSPPRAARSDPPGEEGL